MLPKIKLLLPAKTSHRILFGIFCIAVFCFGFLLADLGYTLSKMFIKKETPSQLSDSFTKASPKPLNNHNPQEGVYNVLLLGYGGPGHEGSLLTDSIIVIHVNTNTKKTALISIPRDLWVPGNKKVNTTGVTGFTNVGPVIQNVTGLPINYFVAVDFGGFTKIINNIGPITVNVPVTFDDPFYPIAGEENNVCGFTENQIFEFKNQFQGFELEKQFPCRYEHLHFDQGQTALDGETALKYVRSRHGDSDFGRSRRQFSILTGLATKLISLQSLSKIDNTINTLSQMVKTDLDFGTIKSLIDVLGNPTSYATTEIQLTTDNVLTQGFATTGEFILTPKAGDFNFTEVKSYITSQL